MHFSSSTTSGQVGIERQRLGTIGAGHFLCQMQSDAISLFCQFWRFWKENERLRQHVKSFQRDVNEILAWPGFAKSDQSRCSWMNLGYCTEAERQIIHGKNAMATAGSAILTKLELRNKSNCICRWNWNELEESNSGFATDRQRW